MIPVYRGQPRQVGYGLGSMFKRMASNILPLIKPIVKSGLHTLKTEGVKQGLGAVQDIMSGQNIKHVLKNRGKTLLKDVGQKALDSIKTSPVKRPHQSHFDKLEIHKSRKVSDRPRDIFDTK